MRILITGHKGQLGQALWLALAGADLHGLDLPEVDVGDAAATADAVGKLQPQVVVHAAAMTDVDACQRQPELAFRANTLGTLNVALGCARAGATLLHVSTNEVFDGRLGRPYYEWEPPSPLSVYAQSKAGAEFYVRTLLRRFFIVRTAWLYGRGGRNFVSKIQHAADRQGELSVVQDEVSSPTYAPDLARAIAALTRTDHYGIYHLTNSGYCSRYEWARRVLALSGRGQVPVTPISSQQWQRAAPPPLFTPLHNVVGAAIGITLRPWQEALAECLAGA